MAASTRARVGSLTRGLSLSTRDTVPAPTPACAATSAMVTTTPLSRASPWNRFQISWAGTYVAPDEVSMEALPRAGDSSVTTGGPDRAARRHGGDVRRRFAGVHVRPSVWCR